MRSTTTLLLVIEEKKEDKNKTSQQQPEEPPLVVEIISQESNEFTIRGQDPKLEDLIRQQKIIPRLILKYDDGSISYPIIEDIVLQRRHTNTRRLLWTDSDNTFYVTSTFWFTKISDIPEGTIEDIAGCPDSIYR
jgi:hypothetical protein